MSELQVNLSEFPFSARSLVRLLHEGRVGNEARFFDEAIANWCYELFTTIDGNLYLDDGFLPRDAVRDVAYHVSAQWEADLFNASGRVLSANLFQDWLLQLGRGDV